MEAETLGKVVVTAKIENFYDVESHERGLLPADQVRTVEVTDALVDTGATTLLLPKRLIADLGLAAVSDSPGTRGRRSFTMAIYTAVRLTIQKRDCFVDVGEIEDHLPVLIGQVPLELLDFVVDPKRKRLIGNPDHGGEHIIEVF